MTKKTILAVDDNKDILETLSIVLGEYNLITENTYEGAILKIKKEKIDLVLIDVMLSESKTGFDLFNEIIDYNNKIRCIFLTAIDAKPDKRLKLEEQGAYDYITKPFENDDLISSINTALNLTKINDVTILGYGDIGVASSPVRLRTTLGSCVAVVFYDSLLKIGGMTHIVIPKGKNKFDTRGAEESIGKVLKKLEDFGCQKHKLKCEMYGGSDLYGSDLKVGSKNIDLAKEIIKKEGIKISKEEIGGKFAREIELDTKEGEVNVNILKPIEMPNS